MRQNVWTSTLMSTLDFKMSAIETSRVVGTHQYFDTSLCPSVCVDVCCNCLQTSLISDHVNLCIVFIYLLTEAVLILAMQRLLLRVFCLQTAIKAAVVAPSLAFIAQVCIRKSPYSFHCPSGRMLHSRAR